MTIDSHHFWNVLKRNGYNFLAGVPDSTFGKAYKSMLDDPEIKYVPAVREDIALGVASAGFFSGIKTAVLLQNSGVGNIVNPLTSFNLIYNIPVLLIVGWRGYGGPANDAPEHWIMGAKTREIFELLEIPFEVLELDGFERALIRLETEMDKRSVPGVLLIRPGILS